MLALAFLAGLPLGQAVTLIDYESSWHLWRGQRAPSKPDYWAWNKPDFDDSGWETAVSPIFFGEKVKGGTELTDMKSKYNSFFVRKKFDSPAPEHITSATLRAKVDDGFVAYINGTEVARYNVTTEKPKYSSKSTKAATEPLRFMNYEIDDFKSVLKNGENTLAIIVLNQRRTSPDVMFDAKLSVVSDESDPPMVASTLPPRGLAADLEQITVNFDEPVEGVDASDLLINGKPALAVTGGGRTWVFEPGPLSHGKVQLTWVQDHGITDQALTPNAFKATAAGNRWTYTLRRRQPTLCPTRQSARGAGSEVAGRGGGRVQHAGEWRRRGRPAHQRPGGQVGEVAWRKPVPVCAWPSGLRRGEHFVLSLIHI